LPPSISSLTSSQTERRGGDIARAAATHIVNITVMNMHHADAMQIF
jgi:hypothetical protein